MSHTPPPVEVRIEICKYASEHGVPAAAEKYEVQEATVRKWRKQLGFPPLQRHARRR